MVPPKEWQSFLGFCKNKVQRIALVWVFEHLCWVGGAQPMLKFGFLWNLLGVGKVK
jgi:hypothetical protein